ncbi:MAG: hypothetical protein IT445_16015 [Phycisphaeraceae bacterium]|nr:hypothetical protein [Phycisphaeraceae bacterium]
MNIALSRFLLIVSLFCSTAFAQSLDETGQSAAFLLHEAVTPRRDGGHEALLESLRHMRDPQMRPLYEALANAAQPSLQLHGLLGLIETDESHQVDLEAIGQMSLAPLQAELIARALDEKLMSTEVADQLLTWPGMEPAVKLIVATRLLAQGQFNDPEIPAAAMQGGSLGRRALAALLLAQLQDPRGTEALSALNASTEPQRDTVRAEMLQTAMRHKFNQVAAWAYSIATEPQVNGELEMLALNTGLRFGHVPSMQRWTKQYEALADNLPRRRRMGLLALTVAPYVKADLFDVMIADSDSMLAATGRAGRAIASESPEAGDRIAELIELQHPLLNKWVLRYAEHEASPQSAQFVLLGLIVAFEKGEVSDRLSRLDDAAQAAKLLMDMDPQSSAKLLRPILASDGSDDVLKQAVLLGLIRCQLPSVSDVIDGLTFNQSDTRTLALLLRARDGQKLDGRDLEDFKLIVQGGSRLQDSLRIQAAWAYLKMTDQIRAGIDRALEL